MAGCISHVKKSVPKSIDKAECGLRTETRRARERESKRLCVFLLAFRSAPVSVVLSALLLLSTEPFFLRARVCRWG